MDYSTNPSSPKPTTAVPPTPGAVRSPEGSITAPIRTPSGSSRPPSNAPQQDDSDDLTATRVSHVRILPTSLPYVHDQLMEQRDILTADKEDAAHGGQGVDDEAVGGASKEPSPEEQAATARALKPHSRSIVDLHKLRLHPPERTSAPHPSRKPRKWQFGIRSRNQPYEAMLYLYKAIEAQGGVWEILPAESEGNQTEIGWADKAKPLQRKYADLPSDYYIPEDPWFIRARLLKEGVKAPGMPISSRNSRSDLEELRRRGNASDKSTSSTSGVHSSDNLSPVQSSTLRISYGVWVFIDIQLYQLEENNYMVDFKCDGYQNVIRAQGDSEWHAISKRFKNKEKEVNSPYPFLDVASDLVAQLAVAG